MGPFRLCCLLKRARFIWAEDARLQLIFRMNPDNRKNPLLDTTHDCGFWCDCTFSTQPLTLWNIWDAVTICKQGFRDAEINLGGNRTLMYCQVTPIAEHDRVDVFPLSIITNGTGGILRGQRTVVFGHPLHLKSHKKRNTSQYIVLCLPVRTIPSLSGP